MAKQKRFSEQFREAVDSSGMTRYRIAKELGLTQGAISKFMAGGWLSLEVADNLADLLGLYVGVKSAGAKPKPRR
jgi:transcriptional regulator with XRE-family HTH domain